MATENVTGCDSMDATIFRAELSLDRLLGWVRASESRLALVLPLSTAMLGTLAAFVPPVGQWTVVGGIAASFAFVLLLLSIAFAACASFPRTKGPKGSLIYFGGITPRALPQYNEAIISTTPEAYLDDLVSQCHRNAQIAERKYAWVQRSLACLFIAALPWVMSVFILYSAES